jgi:hypothetical protein
MINPLGVDPILESLIRHIEETISARRAGYDDYRAYYMGDQSVKLTTRLKAFLGIHDEQEFRDNFCEVVVDALADRLIVAGFQGPSEAVTEFASNVWRINRMDYQQTVIHTEAVLLGDGYVLVDWDNARQTPRFSIQVGEMIVPHYGEDSRQLEWVSKKWTEVEGFGSEAEKIERLNLYYPDRVEKYRARGNHWVQHSDDGDTAWPIPWVMPDGSPIGVPIIHFANKPLSQDFGISEIANVIPLQDLLNKTLVDLTMLNDGAGFGRWWGLDLEGDASQLKVSPGSVTMFNSVEPGQGTLGQWAPTDPDGILKTIEMLLQHVSAISRTPQHYFTIMGGAPSGESLKVAEAGLIDKAKRRQVNFGNSWEDCMMLARRLQAVFGPDGPGDLDAPLETEWADAERRNEEAWREELRLKAELGIPQQQIWREMGYSQEDIDLMLQDKQDERVRDTNLGAELLRRFSAGNEE